MLDPDDLVQNPNDLIGHNPDKCWQEWWQGYWQERACHMLAEALAKVLAMALS